MFQSPRKTIALVAGMTLTLTLAVAAPAHAVYAACGAWKDEKDVLGPNVFRANAQCSRIDSDTKVRAKLVRAGGPDYYSSWTTVEYYTVSTKWYTCYSGCYATFEVAKR